jgi:hypothetical protein
LHERQGDEATNTLQRLPNIDMPDLSLTRRRNLLLQFARFSQAEIAAGRSGSAAAFSEKLGIHPTLLSKLRGAQAEGDARDVSDKLARQFEVRLGLAAGWLDQEQDGAPLTSAETSFLELALRAYRAADAPTRRALRRQLQALADE